MTSIATSYLMKRVRRSKNLTLTFNAIETIFSIFLLKTISLPVTFLKAIPYEPVSNSLFTLVVSLITNFEFEIYYQKSQKTTKIANALYSRLIKHQAKTDETFGKTRVILVDRTMDLISPLIHDFYYVSLVNNLLSVENNILN